MPTLNWIGKDKVVTHHQDVPFRVLERKYTFGDEHDSGNMIIHGDNLEALKALLPRYENRIKCIYIDPPYNTGNEGWVYNDNVNDPHIRKWLGQVVGSEMDDLSRHDKWLCMMYPRLVLLQKLLADDGAIFISIDDNEQANLKLICDEIFGATNFLTTFIWVNSLKESIDEDTKFAGANLGKIKNSHEYILVYVKQNYKIAPDKSSSKYIEKLITNGGNNINRCIIRKGIECTENINKVFHGRIGGVNDYFDILNPEGMIVKDGILQNDIEIEGPLRNANMLTRFFNGEEVIDNKGQRLVSVFFGKTGMIQTRKLRVGDTPTTVLVGKGTAKNGTLLLKQMFGNKVFDFSKPHELISYIVSKIYGNDFIILDSFAGSGTTAHAVLNLNRQDGGNRKFILCEMCDYAETITAERVRRVMSGYGEGKNAVKGPGGSFDFYELGETIFEPDSENLNDNADTEQIRQYIWYSETHTAYHAPGHDTHPYLLGTYQYNNYYFYYIKGEETCLDWEFLNTFTERDRAEMYIIYADRCVLTEKEMMKLNIRFKKIPRDIKHI